MQTRRDQLQAYRFQNRRALAALVTGQPNVVEPPMRRLTVTTISGIMIAVLVTVGFALFGFIRPKTGDAWKAAGAIVSEQDTGARYLYDGQTDTLYPVSNYTSAVLAVAGNQKPHEEIVDRDDLKGVKRGPTIGVPGLPDTIPKKNDLVSFPVAVCSRQQGKGDASDDLTAKVSLALGSDDGARLLSNNSGVIVNTGGNTTQYLLTNGRRYAIKNNQVTFNLTLDTTRPLQVGTAFLSGVPAGPDLGTPSIPNQGQLTGLQIDGRTPRVGQLLSTHNRYRVVLSDGVASVNDVEAALLKTLPIGAGGRPLNPLAASGGAANNLQPSSAWSTIESQVFGQLPSTVPRADQSAGDAGGICLVYRSSSEQPLFGVPKSLIPNFHNNGVSESQQSLQSIADQVEITYGKGALVKAEGEAKTVFLVDDSQQRFAAKNSDVLKALGYGDVKPLELSAQLLRLIKQGPAMDPGAVRKPTG